MKSFKTFMDHSQGTYINLKLDDESKTKLFAFVKTLDIFSPLQPDTYHVTITYSRKPCPDAEQYQFLLPVTCKAKEWKLFDTQKGGKCLVLVLDSPELVQMHNDIKQAYGATHDYPDYHPHVTICYNYEKDNVPSILPDFHLTFVESEVKGLDLDFVPGKS